MGDKVLVLHRLHLVDGLEPGAPAFDPEVFVEQRAAEPFRNAAGPWSVDLRGAVLDVRKLGEPLAGMDVRAPAELACPAR